MSANDSTEFHLTSGHDKAQTNINAPAKGREEEVCQEVNTDFNNNGLKDEEGKKAFLMLVRRQRFTQHVSVENTGCKHEFCLQENSTKHI